MECSRCGFDRNLFVYNKFGVALFCKVCNRADQKKYRATEPAKKKAAARKAEKINKRRQLIVDYLKEHPCVDCGEADIIVLDFDHVIGDKKDDISNMLPKSYSMKSLTDEIAKCVVRCSNCHRRKTAIENGSYRVRAARGELIYNERENEIIANTILDIDKANTIREEYSKGNISYQKLADKYNVGNSTIRDVIKGITWIKLD